MKRNETRDLTAKTKKAFASAPRPLLPGASDRRLVRELLPEIRQKKAEGWTYAELAAALAETFGFKVSRQTLAVYVSQLNRAAAPAAGGDAAVGQRPPQKSQHADSSKNND